jgi:hemerythrin-like domain-containing protein
MSDFVNPPLQRHVSLQPFSRDHYVGLVRAQRLIRSAQSGAEQRRTAVRDFLAAWEQEIRAHFADEEELLLPVVDEPDGQRLRREHERLRALAAQAAGHAAAAAEPAVEFVRELGQTLNDHIRWEERELFPRVEHRLSAEQLAQIGMATAQIEASRPRSRKRAKPPGSDAGSARPRGDHG